MEIDRKELRKRVADFIQEQKNLTLGVPGQLQPLEQWLDQPGIELKPIISKSIAGCHGISRQLIANYDKLETLIEHATRPQVKPQRY